jgi:hypothetical protein
VAVGKIAFQELIRTLACVRNVGENPTQPAKKYLLRRDVSMNEKDMKRKIYELTQELANISAKYAAYRILVDFKFSSEVYNEKNLETFIQQLLALSIPDKASLELDKFRNLCADVPFWKYDTKFLVTTINTVFRELFGNVVMDKIDQQAKALCGGSTNE